MPELVKSPRIWAPVFDAAVVIVPELVNVPEVMLRYEDQLACDAILMVPELVVKVFTVRALYDVSAVA